MNRATIKFLAVLGVPLLFGLTMLSCDDEDAKPDRLGEMRTNITTGVWEITYFFDKTDETNNFTGWAFVFNDDETVRATRDTEAVSGTWEVRSASNGEKFTLDFGVIEPFGELNDDWDIKEYTESKIVLEDISGGSGEIDYLTLEKM